MTKIVVLIILFKNQDDNLDKNQCKIYLLNLAKDLYVNY